MGRRSGKRRSPVERQEECDWSRRQRQCDDPPARGGSPAPSAEARHADEEGRQDEFQREKCHIAKGNGAGPVGAVPERSRCASPNLELHTPTEHDQVMVSGSATGRMET